MPESDTPLALRDFLKRLTSEPGVYRMVDTNQQVLYVGKANNLKKRVSSYFNKTHDNARIRSLVRQIHHIDITVTRSETEALLLESNLIKSLRPKYNVLMRDDKSYPYIKVTAHPFPRMEMFRSKKKPTSGEFYGPYPSVYALKATLNTIQKLFKIRNCRDSFFNARSRPCLQYQIKRCTAPCTQYVTETDYQQQVKNARRFLQGKSLEILQELEMRMTKAVAQLAFEEAAILRDQIKQLRITQEQQGITQLRGEADAIAIDAKPGFACVQVLNIRNGEVLNSQSFFPSVPILTLDENEPDQLWQQVFNAFIARYYFDEPNRIPGQIIIDHHIEDKKASSRILSELRGKRCVFITHPRMNKRQWLELARHNLQQAVNEHRASKETLRTRFAELETTLQLPNPIQRMECFDISHTSGEATVASCVVFNRQGPSKKDYRQFNIEGITPGDDYAAIQQALKRRLGRLQAENNLPDLLIIDGGKGQISVAQQVINELGVRDIYLLGIAKGPERKAGWERLILGEANKEIRLERHSSALHLLQHIRDEAHRFAITQHRKKRQKIRRVSELENIEGIGARRRQALLNRFGGIQELKNASREEIAKVTGISPTLAENIYAYFHPE